MTFEVEISGKLFLVTFSGTGQACRTGGPHEVTVHCREESRLVTDATSETVTVDARQTDSGWSLIYGDGRSVDAAVTERPGGETLVQLPHVDVPTVVDGRRYRRAGGDAGGSGEQRICAPMPGRVLRVMVSIGDEVLAGQPVVVIEAMKMENALKSARAGTVREVCVIETTLVEAGRLLVVVE